MHIDVYTTMVGYERARGLSGASRRCLNRVSGEEMDIGDHF